MFRQRLDYTLFKRCLKYQPGSCSSIMAIGRRYVSAVEGFRVFLGIVDTGTMTAPMVLPPQFLQCVWLLLLQLLLTRQILFEIAVVLKS